MFTDTVECLTNGAPHAGEAKLLLDYFAKLPTDTHLALPRVLSTLYLTHLAEEMRLRDKFSIAEFKKALGDTLEFAKHAVKMQEIAHARGAHGQAVLSDEFEKITQSHYGNLFQSFSEYHYYEEPLKLLKTRFERNEITFKGVEKLRAIDVGCGGGRYTLALQQLGFSEVVGVDFSALNLETARSRAAAKKISNVTYQEADVLSLPLPDNSFDFVFSNGVLHHTSSIEKGLRELYRIMKPGASSWLFIIAKPGGVEWDTVEILRQIMRPVPHDFARQTLLLAGIPQNRIFYILDHIMVPINTMSSIEDVESLFKKIGITQFRRLTRGTDFDATEMIFQRSSEAKNDPDFIWKYGVGEHRYVFKK